MINFNEYVQKPNLVARLTKAEEPAQKKELLHKKRAIEQNNYLEPQTTPSSQINIVN